MRQGHIVKGFCPECLDFRAFQVTQVSHYSQSVRSFTSVEPIHVPGPSLYQGNCSSGHEVPFARVDNMQVYSRRYFKRTPPKGLKTREEYESWKELYRRPSLEAHFKKDHVCEWGCPKWRDLDDAAWDMVFWEDD